MAEYHIGSQRAENIQMADVINNHAPATPDYRALGMNALRSRHYQQSASYFASALMEDPTNPDLHYYTALALLNGERPNRHSKVNVEAIERHLLVAAGLPHAVALSALVAEDYGLTWRRFSSIPPALIRLAGAVTPQHRREILDHVPAPEARTWKALQRRT